MCIRWIVIACLISEAVFSQEPDAAFMLREFCLEPDIRNRGQAIDDAVKCDESDDVLQIAHMRYECFSGSCQGVGNAVEVPFKNSKILFVFARLCNGRNSCEFNGGDGTIIIESEMDILCQGRFFVAFKVGINCGRSTDHMIDLCSEPSEQFITSQTPYIYSPGYPDKLPFEPRICSCTLQGTHIALSPYIELTELQLRGTDAGAEKLEIIFTKRNGDVNYVCFEYIPFSDSNSHLNTRRDLSQALLLGSNFTNWSTIEIIFHQRENQQSTGLFMLKFDPATKVRCSELRSIETSSVEIYDECNREGPITLMPSNGSNESVTSATSRATQGVYPSSNSSRYTTETIDVDSGTSSSHTQPEDERTTVGSVPQRKEKQKDRSKEGVDLGLTVGVVVAAVVIIIGIIIVVICVFIKRKRRQKHPNDISFEASHSPTGNTIPMAFTELTNPSNNNIIPIKDHLHEVYSKANNSASANFGSSSLYTKGTTSEQENKEQGNADESPVLHHRNSTYVSGDEVEIDTTHTCDHINSVYTRSAETKPEESPVFHRNSGYMSADSVERTNVSPPVLVSKLAPPIETGIQRLSASGNSATYEEIPFDIDQGATPVRDFSIKAPDMHNSIAHSSVPLHSPTIDKDNYHLYDDSHRKIPSTQSSAPVPNVTVVNDDNAYDEALPARTEPQYAPADNPSISTSDSGSAQSGSFPPGSGKLAPRDRTQFPDYAYSYAKTRGDGTVKTKPDPDPDLNQDPYSYVKAGDVEPDIPKPKREVTPESHDEHPYSYADLRGRVLHGITEHVKVPGYELAGGTVHNSDDTENTENVKNTKQNPTDPNIVPKDPEVASNDSGIAPNDSMGQYTLEKPVVVI